MRAKDLPRRWSPGWWDAQARRRLAARRRYTFQEGRWKGFIDRPALQALREKGELKPAPYRKGDFNLKPDAKLKELMPQFQPIPWDKIGLCKDELRK